jgi:HD-like signal output (HDOD) protein
MAAPGDPAQAAGIQVPVARAETGCMLGQTALTLSPGDESAGDPHEAFLERISRDIGLGPVNLPCFPDIVPRIRRALDDPNSSADSIVRIAGSEPRLSARLIQTANSVVFNPTGRPAPNLRSAIARLGHTLVQTVVMVFALQQLKAEPRLRGVIGPLADLWQKSVAVASICETLARELGVPTDKVFLAGLVHGIGHFYILVRAAEPASGVEVTELPPELIAARHPAIGRAVLEKWGFEHGVCAAVGRQYDHRRHLNMAADLTDLLIAGVVLAEMRADGSADLARCENVTAFGRIGLAHDELRTILEHTDHAIGVLRASLVD